MRDGIWRRRFVDASGVAKSTLYVVRRDRAMSLRYPGLFRAGVSEVRTRPVEWWSGMSGTWEWVGPLKAEHGGRESL